MSFEEALKGAMAKMLQSIGIDAVRVNSYAEAERWDGYCETCYYQYDVVEINYIDSKGVISDYEWYGEFSELIRTLEEFS